MAAVLQFSGVAYEKISGLSFSLDAAELQVLRVASKEEKVLVMELALGERIPEAGSITLHGAALGSAPPGSISWIPAQGGLISNLKTWENVTLPLWYHGKYLPSVAEDRIKHWLAALGVDGQDWEIFMASPTGKLKPVERKLAGLLRGLLQSPSLLVIDAILFDGLEQAMRNAWVAALELSVRESNGAVLVVAEKETMLPWNMME